MSLEWGASPLAWGAELLDWQGAQMLATYAPRCYVHPDRYGGPKSVADILLVVHTSEGGELTTSAEALCSYMGQPGDRAGATGPYGSSYQYVIDTDCVRPAVPDRTISYSAGGANHNAIHFCIPGKAGQTRDQWLDTNSRAHILMLAKALVDKSVQTGIPLVKLSVFQVASGRTGVCGHDTVSLAFKKSDHTDPGINFPWDVLFDDIARLTEGDEMTPEIPPRRILDTRILGGKVAVGQIVEVGLGVTGSAALVNFTVTQPDGPGFVTAWGYGTQPETSNVNYGAGQTVANLASVPLDTNGVFRFTVGTSAAHVIVDHQGTFT